MERAGALIAKLQEQYAQQAGAAALSVTAQMLSIELQKHRAPANGASKKVSVIMPTNMAVAPLEGAVASPQKPLTQADIFEEEKPVELKTESPETKERQPSWESLQLLQIPTLAHQKKEVYELDESLLNETLPPVNLNNSLNEKLKTEKIEVATVLQDSPIKDLKKAIGINDRYLFINELFRGDEAMYERSVKTINSFNIFPEAEYWIKRELKLKLGWKEDDETVAVFDQLVKRRFS